MHPYYLGNIHSFPHDTPALFDHEDAPYALQSSKAYKSIFMSYRGFLSRYLADQRR